MQVVAADAAFQQPARHAGSEVAAEEVKAFPTLSEVNDPRLLWMQLQPQTGQDLPGQRKDRPRLVLRTAEHDEVVRPADSSPR